MSTIKSGDSGEVANVTKDKQLMTSSVSETSLEFASKAKEKAYSWTSTYAATGAEEVIYVKNTSTTDVLVIDEVVVGSSVANVFTLFKVDSGTAAGTTITGLNLSLQSGKTASATSFGNASVTGTLAGSVIAYDGAPADAFETLDLLGSVVLGQNDEISVTAAVTGTVYVTVIGHYKAI